MKLKKLKYYWDKFWYLLWKDDSFKGWLFSVIFMIAFILIIFFPALRFVTGTSLPLAIVESCSMYHDGNLLSDFNIWWEQHEDKYSQYTINQLDFKDFIFKNGFNKGDILFIIKAKPEKLEQGDVIIFDTNYRNPIIHRIMEINQKEDEYIISTIGDNNNGQISSEKSIKEHQLVGKAVFKLAPYLGWIKLIFFEHQKSDSEKGLCEQN